MKNVFKQFPLAAALIFAVSILFFCAWQNPDKTYSSKSGVNVNQKDTIPKKYEDRDFNMDEFNEAMKTLDMNMANLGSQMKDFNVNLDKQINALTKINIEEIKKQTEASLKIIDWNKMQENVNASLQNTQKEIAKIDFSKMQGDIKNLQEKLSGEQFKQQLNSEKINQQIKDAMSKAKESIDKAKVHLEQMKNFINELAADGLIDKTKGYTIKWIDGNLYINGKEQPKNISDKYRKYENDAEIKMLPENAERF